MARVLFLYPSEFLGPVLTVYSQIVRHLDRSRFEPYLAVNADATGRLPLGQGEAVVTRWAFGRGLGEGSAGERLVSLLKLARSMAALVRYSRREDVGVVQCTATPYAGTLALALATALRIPLVVHVHELVGRYAGGDEHTPSRRLLERVILRCATRVVAVSSFIASDLVELGVPAGKVTVIRNGVDLERFSPDVDGSAMRREYGVGEGDVLALQLGRIVASKRQQDFATALALALRVAPTLRGLIVGWEDPADRAREAGARAVAREHALGDRLIIGAARPEAPQLIAAADIVVMPSLDEAFPLVVLEAMGAGKPVVGVRSGSIAEQVADGETGFIVPPMSPQAVAEGLIRLAREPGLRRSMGAKGRRRAEQAFTEARVAAEFGALYATLT